MKMRLPVRGTGLAACVGVVMAAVWLVMCGPQLPIATPEDAGNESFARQVVPLLYGRKVKGYDEVKLLSDLATLIGRDKLVRALMRQPEYIDHWSETLVDILRVQREGSRAQTDCYGAPLRSGPDDAALAQWILSHAAGAAAPAGGFNMSDVLRSSLKLDNLYPLYAAHLFAMENKPDGFFPQEQRNSLGATFGQVYLHREMLCLTCHNSERSLSGASSGWNRTYPIPGYFERALYSAAEGEPTTDAFAMFRTDVLGGGTAPWGIQNCGTFQTSVPNDPLGYTAQFAGSQGQQFTIRGVQTQLAQGYAGLDTHGLQRTLAPGLQAQCDFCAANCSGSSIDPASVANGAPNASAVKNLLTNTVWSNNKTCMNCHGGSAGLYFTTGTDWANDLIGVPSSEQPGLYLVKPGDANSSYLVRKLEGTLGITAAQMPSGATPMTAAQINLVKDWINGMPLLGACGPCPNLNCSQPRNYVDGHKAFAFLTAANAVNKAWTETLGSPLTIANYYPRNPSQLDALWNLTEYRFVPREWSLQYVIESGLTSTLFNRKAPRFSALGSPYVAPPLFDPWTVADPRVPPVSVAGYVPTNHPENHFNAMTESVHRYSARSLLNSVHGALGWSAPQRFPAAGTYPTTPLEKAIGQYFTDTEPGFQGVDLQGLLFWESVHGACVKPTGAAQDWVDRVVDAVNNFGPASPGGPLTVQDVVVLSRDWLLGHGNVETSSPVGLPGTESAALEAYFGVPLTQSATGLANLNGKLRGYCGVLLETPQFMLAGIAPSGLGPKPRLRVCNGAPCTYQEICSAVAPAVNAQLGFGDFLLCGADSVGLINFRPPRDLLAELCPPGLCGLGPERIPEGCFRNFDAKICAVEPPACDPRCARIDCCGGPLPPLDRRQRRPLLAWVEGVQVREAEGVKILPRGSSQLEPLRPGRRLRYGDLLAIPTNGRLRINTERGQFRTPKEGLGVPEGTVFMLVTGEQALKQREDAQVSRKPPMDRILRVRNSAWARRGEAGLSLTKEEFQSYRYAEKELGLDLLIKRGLWPLRQREQQPPPKQPEAPKRE